jgi:gliding motility-associated protein GldM
MSQGKETPRQKMISMMYLVLTALLALNVSREVLDGFVTINESIETTNSNFTGNTQKIMEAIDEAVHQGRHEFVPYYAKAKRVTQLTQQAFDYVEKVKKNVIQYTEDRAGADTMQLKYVEQLDNFDRPTFFLIGQDETKLKKDPYSASDMRLTIQNLADSLNAMLDYMKDRNGLRLPERDYQVLKDKIRLFTPHDQFKDMEGKPLSWEMKNFYNMPLAAVVTNLSKIQSDIRNMEAELVSSFASASGKLSVKFNQMQARIVPVSRYIQSGSRYEADVFLSASSSDFKEDNLQFILGDVDTASGKVADDAVILPIDRGTGKISLPTGAAGHRDISGWIKFREGTGNYRYFKYQNEFIVANPAVAVSPDMMNVFYAGIDNPITVSAAGVAPGDLVVSMSGGNGSLVPVGNGKYTVKVSGSGTCSVSVFQRTAGGLRPQGAPQVFRVKRIPSPPLRVAGKSTYSNLELKVSEAKIISALGVDNSVFEFNAPFRVLSFEMTTALNGVGEGPFVCKDSQLSADARKAISKLKSGSKMFFENIKVQAPDGPRDFPMMKITVK